jgi:ketosteroid isomerase-like protein
MDKPLKVMNRLVDAMNRHDVEAMLECFQDDYESFQPLRPSEAFKGSEQVRKNWSRIFESIPDVRAEILRSASSGDTAWIELSVTGTRPDGNALDMRGVVINGVADDRIAWARLYLEQIFEEVGDIDQGVGEMIEGN